MNTFTEKQKQDRRDAQRRWRERNLETAKQRSRNTEYRRKYGINLEQYDEMLKSQQGVCAICNKSCDTGMNLAVDHCHETNKVRGLLCKNCNTAIGLLKENVENMNKAINYIKFHTITEEIA
jgi:hypothetical protein